MTISQRIFEELKKKGMKQKDLALYIGLSTSAVSDWKKKGTNPAAENISAIADFLGVTTDYLLIGKEKSSPTVDMTADEHELLNVYKDLSYDNKIRVRERAAVLAEFEAALSNKVVEEPDEESIFIEYSVCSVSAGTGEPLIDESYPDFIEVKKSELTEEANFAVKINGDSMFPHFKDNDIVLVRSQPHVEIGQIGIFIIDGSGYIKKRGEDRLISLNHKYDDICFRDGQDIRCKGLVIGTLEHDDFV